jgi:glycosyltransferase involved in cell wall biosynthesis
MHRVDLTWVLSSFEKELLETHLGVSPKRLALSRFAYPKQRPASFEKSFDERRGFSFVGNYRHAPNLDAFRWLRDELWSQIRARLPHAELELWGAYPTQEVFEAHEPRRGFLVRGVAQTMDQVLGSTRVSLAPVRFGAGIKGKISDSWHFGVPVVSTPLGFEGMVGEGALIGGARLSGEALAEYAVKLYLDSAAWSEARDWGLRQLDQSFSLGTFEKELAGGIARARENFSKRDQDWIRRCFTHHSLETPRFFGKWLELKESKR